ncbi:hypothetical protein GKZ90_0021055 [Flavobacterium sp. MC2016-06]|jgi:hypothetical protein|uniref:hypothetical protein n=1 Tax=Flavobacterium sp. MC2016-06 TaxID=2676308 RepID=UPI0012BAE08A|nr:hypothetical protein [Flavobacterium sp. MC2016-06]MBU3860990.1 hypothetical protein [Flavobacterium sp. MC2016-06]
MQLVTEIYVAPLSGSTDYVKLDLIDNEAINLKYTLKDVTDLSKVFAPYSLSFSIQATPKNRAALQFFGDTDVIKTNLTGSFPCKIYTDGNLNLVGNFNVEGVRYDYNGIGSIQGAFETDLKSLKDRLGTDLITELGSVLTGSTAFQYTPTAAKNSIESKQFLLSENGIDINYITPLASTNRVWSYDPNGDVTDNISYTSSVSGVTSERAILTTELRPAINYRSLVEMMFLKYDLKVNMPLRNDKLFNEMFVWVNGAASDEKLNNTNVLKFGSTFNNQYINSWAFALAPTYPNNPTEVVPPEIEGATPYKYKASYYTNNGYDVVKINIGDKPSSTLPDTFQLLRTYKSIRLNIQLTDMQVQSTNGKASISLRKPNGTKAPADCEELLTVSVDIAAGNNTLFVDIPDTLFDGYTVDYTNYPTFEAYILFKSDLASWTTTNIFTQYIYYADPDESFNTWEIIAQRAVSDGAEQIKSSGNLDLIQSLPKVKVFDFFQSFLKTFNLSIFNPIVNVNELQILSVEDIDEIGKPYAKKEVDYTPFVDVTSYSKSVQDKYNKYNFKHATSKYKSNVDFLAGNPNGLEYGQITQDNKNAKINEYSVVTTYTIIPPRNIINTNLITYYGFSNESTDEPNRYKPINNELVLFVNNELSYLTNGVQLGFLMGNSSVVPLSRYMSLLPWFSNSMQSLGFSVLVDDVSGVNTTKDNSLYKRFYESQTARLLNVNVLSHKFDLTLPSSEVYVNPTRANEPPTGFRLQNDIIIGETRFSILDANVDITTGKTKLTLLNYVINDDNQKEIIPTPNIYNPDGYNAGQYKTI